MKQIRKLLSMLLRPLFGIDSDSNLLDVKNVRVIDSLNTRIVTDGGQTGMTREIVRGNSFAFKPDPVTIKNRIFKITVSCESTEVYCFDIIDGNGLLIDRTANIINTVGDIYATMASVQGAIETTLAANSLLYNPIVTAAIDANTGYLEVEITSVPAWQYQITQQSHGNNIVLNSKITGSPPADWAVTAGVTLTFTGTDLDASVLAGAAATAEATTETLVPNWQHKYSIDCLTYTNGRAIVHIGNIALSNAGFTPIEAAGTVNGVFKTGAAPANLVYISFSHPTTATTMVVDNFIANPKLSEALIEIIQEVVDGSMLGEWEPLHSFDYNGKLFVWWANQLEPPRVLNISSVTLGGAGRVRITTIGNHGATVDQLVVIAGSGVTDGSWMIIPISATEFDLYGSAFTSGSATGTVTLGSRALGEIGLGEKNLSTGVWTYTRLVRTDFNFRLRWQIEGYVERDQLRYSIYWVDHNNPDRAIYYRGEFMDDGVLTSVNPEGLYDYGSILQETLYVLNASGMTIEFTGQRHTGGNIAPGNHYYTAVFLTSELTSSDNINIVGPINAGVGGPSAPQDAYGSDPSALSTTKANDFLIKGIPPGVFKYVELIDLNYIGTNVAPVGQIVTRVQLGENDTEIVVQHTGFENNVRDYDVGLLASAPSPYVISKNICAVDNSMIRSNIKKLGSIDFSDFFKTFKHRLFREELPSIGNEGYRFGEYQDPISVCYKGSFMLLECYRFYGRIEFRGGGFSDSFWIDDVIFNTLSYNIDAAYADNRRDGNDIPDYDITDVGATKVYTFGISFHGFDTQYSINGIPLSSIAKKIHIEAVEMTGTNREILTSGMLIMGASGETEDPAGFWYLRYTEGNETDLATIGPNPFISGGPNNTFNLIGGFFPSNMPYTDFNNILKPLAQRKYPFMLSPDILIYGSGALERQGGDKLIVLGTPDLVYRADVNPTGGIGTDSFHGEYDGATGITGDLIPGGYDIEDMRDMTSNVELMGGNNVSTLLWLHLYPAPTTYFSFRLIPLKAMYTTNDILEANTLGNTDRGFYRFYYYRPKSFYGPTYDPDLSKFGNRETGRSFSLNSAFELPEVPVGTLTNIIAALDFKTFGKDVFNQKTFVRHRYPVATNEPSYTDPSQIGMAAGVGFYSQNFANSQMVWKESAVSGMTNFPQLSMFDWFYDQAELAAVGLPEYNYGYTHGRPALLNPVFDPNVEDVTHYETAIIYSDQKHVNQRSDAYRVHRPLNIKFLDYSFGPIVDHFEVNNKLFVLQEGAWRVEFFNSKRMLQTENGAEIIIGDGAAFSARGDVLSKIGSTHKQGRVKGRTKSGKETVYYINSAYACVIRFGADGVTNIVEEKQMTSFFRKNLKFMYNKDNPSGGQGISAVWDDERKEAIWTIRGVADIDAWTNAVIGDDVIFNGGFDALYTDRFGFVRAQHWDTVGNGIMYDFTGHTAKFERTVLAQPNEIEMSIFLPDQTSAGNWRVTFDIVGLNLVSGTDINVKFQLDNGPVSASENGIATGLTINMTGDDTAGMTFKVIVTFDGASLGDITLDNIVLQPVNPKVYGAGEAVRFDPAVPTNYHQIPSIYESLVDNNFDTDPDASPDLWQLVPLSDTRYYNVKTIAFSEQSNDWHTRYSPLPKLYLPWRNTYLTARPVSDASEVYEHNIGPYCLWWDEFEEDAFVEMVANEAPEDSKSWRSVSALSSIVPYRMEFETKNHISFLDASEFEARENRWDCEIKEDSTSNGINEGDTDLLYGSYLKIKFIMQKQVYQNLRNIIVRARTRPKNIR